MGFEQSGSTWNWASAIKGDSQTDFLSGGGAGTSYSPKGVDYNTKEIGVSMDFTFGSSNPTIQDLGGEGFSILCGGCNQYINIVFDSDTTNANSTFVRSATDSRNCVYNIGISDLTSVDNDSLSEAIFNGVNAVVRSDDYDGGYYGSPCADYSEYDVTSGTTVISTLLDRTHNVRIALNPQYDSNDPSKGTKYIFTKEERYSPAMVFIGSGALVAVDSPNTLQGNKEVITVTPGQTMKVTEPVYQYFTYLEDVYGPEGKPLKIHHGPKANQAINIYINDMHTKSLGTDKIYIDDATLPEFERLTETSDRERYEALSYDHKKQLAWLETVKIASDKSLDDISVTTQKNSNVAIRVIDGAIEDALNEATQMGAYLQRLDYTDANVITMGENVQSAESTIRDADMAKEMTEYTKNNVLSQSAQAMLAQANQNSSAVLSLLQ